MKTTFSLLFLCSVFFAQAQDSTATVKTTTDTTSTATAATSTEAEPKVIAEKKGKVNFTLNKKPYKIDLPSQMANCFVNKTGGLEITIMFGQGNDNTLRLCVDSAKAKTAETDCCNTTDDKKRRKEVKNYIKIEGFNTAYTPLQVLDIDEKTGKPNEKISLLGTITISAYADGYVSGTFQADDDEMKLKGSFTNLKIE